MPYCVKYDRTRFPVQTRNADGKGLCRGCGELPKPPKTAWCSAACRERYHPSYVMSAVRARDKDVCAECRGDFSNSKRVWWGQTWNERMEASSRPIAEYDHIVPFSEGGLTVLENIRTLCTTCHAKRTADWYAERAKARKLAKAEPQLTLL